MLSFLANPERAAEGPDGQSWSIRIVRGNAWPGWRWTHRLSDSWLMGDGCVVAVVLLTNLPPWAGRWLAYLVQRRTDWRVLVWEGYDEAHALDAVLDDRCATKELAAARAMELLVAIRAGRWPVGTR